MTTNRSLTPSELHHLYVIDAMIYQSLSGSMTTNRSLTPSELHHLYVHRCYDLPVFEWFYDHKPLIDSK